MTRITTIILTTFLIWTIPTLGQTGDTIANNIIVPKIFKPDKDGAEKVFYIKSLDSSIIKSIKMQIFDRWGKMVFETNNIKYGWDGKYKGEPLPDGTYFYSINAELFVNPASPYHFIYTPYDTINKEQTINVDHTGYITLIR